MTWTIWSYDDPLLEHGRSVVVPEPPRDKTVVVPESRALQAEQKAERLQNALEPFVRAYRDDARFEYVPDTLKLADYDRAHRALSHQPETEEGEAPDG